jgi:hypothetical protein
VQIVPPARTGLIVRPLMTHNFDSCYFSSTYEGLPSWKRAVTRHSGGCHTVRVRAGAPRAVAAVAIPAVLVGLHALVYGRWLVDDAGITFAYARSVATGHGPVLQPGADLVEGYSNPAWLGVLVVGRWLYLFDHGTWFGVPDYVTFPKAVALLCSIGIFASIYAAARAVSKRPALVTVIAGAVTAAVPSFVIWSFSGLENSLLALAVVTLGAVLVRETSHGRLLATRTALVCGLLGAVAALTRPDGLIYMAAYPLAVLLLASRMEWLRALRAGAMSLVAFVVPVGSYFVWRWATFGAWLPNTAVAKGQSLPNVGNLAQPAQILGYAGWLAVLLAAFCVGAVLTRQSQVRTGVIALLVPLVLAVSAFGLLPGDWMGQLRFATPVWPLASFLTVLAAVHLAPHLAPRGRAGLALVTAAAALVSATGWWAAAEAFRANPTAPLCRVAQNTGYEFNGYARILGLEDAALMAPDIGGAALASELEIVDMVGLADERIAQFSGTRDWDAFRDYVFDEVEPTFIRAHGVFRTRTGIDSDPRFAAEYLLISPTPNEGGNWVRRDAVPDLERLTALRAWAAEAAEADIEQAKAPRSSCGEVLSPTTPRTGPD